MLYVWSTTPCVETLLTADNSAPDQRILADGRRRDILRSAWRLLVFTRRHQPWTTTRYDKTKLDGLQCI